jgi:hypothetical protein
MFRRSEIGSKGYRMGRGRCAGFVAACLLLVPAVLRAQTSPNTLGRISGDDISVEGGTPVSSGENPHGVAVSNGSAVTVHSGQARIELVAGGEIDVCGPARLTLLESGGAITVALNLGRVRIQLPGATPLILYTPFFVATPIAITDGPRDATLGLQNNGSLCVLASHGGVRLEQQLTGQTVMVPQPNELTLMGGDLIPIEGVAGGCRCGAAERAASGLEPVITPIPSPPAPAAVAPSEPKPPAASAEKRSASKVETPKLLPPVREFSVPEHANESHPVAPAVQQPPSSLPPEQPVWKVVMPPLTFDASSPLPPPDPSPDTILLVREVRVDPDWVFSGRVEPRSSSPVPPARAASASPKASPQDASQAKKRSFFGKIGNFFRRLAGAPPCQGAGCS